MVSEEEHNRAISHRQTALCLTGGTVEPSSLTMGDYEDEKQEE